jgi:hypothetical protein
VTLSTAFALFAQQPKQPANPDLQNVGTASIIIIVVAQISGADLRRLPLPVLQLH